jgi:hypothetical protein
LEGFGAPAAVLVPQHLAGLGLLTTPVASAAPGQNSWDSGTGSFFDGCTGEWVDNSDAIHEMSGDHAPFHFNLHLAGIGETTGTTYIGNTINNQSVHPLPDGNGMGGAVITVRVVSQGSSPNQVGFALHYHLVVDANGNVISGFFDLNNGSCQGI